MIGTESYPTISTSSLAGRYYAFSVSGTINASNYVFSTLTSSGVAIQPSATVVDLSSGTFDTIQQSIVNDASYIRVSSITSVKTFFGNVFNDTLGTVNYNIRATGPGINWSFGNWSGSKGGPSYTQVSGGAVINWDIAAPASDVNLSAQPGTNPGEVDLQWMMPGSDGWSTTLPAGSQFKVQYSTWVGVSWSTGSAQIVTVSTSGVIPLTTIAYTITNLTSETSYYFHIWHVDDSGNWSGISNMTTGYTGNMLTHIWDGGGTDNLASNPQNWVGDATPSNSDSVVFGSTNPAKYCDWDIPVKNIAVSSLTIESGYQSNVNISTHIYITQDLTITGGNYNLSSGSMTIYGNIYYTGGQFITNTSTVCFMGPRHQYLSLLPGTTFWNVTFYKLTSSTLTVFCQNTQIYINGDIFFRSGKFDTSGSTVNIRGSFSAVSSGGIAASSGRWIIDGLNYQAGDFTTINYFYDLEIYKVNNSTFQRTANALEVQNNMFINRGVCWVDALTVNGDLTISTMAIIKPSNSNVTFAGSKNSILDMPFSSNNTLYGLQIDKTNSSYSVSLASSLWMTGNYGGGPFGNFNISNKLVVFEGYLDRYETSDFITTGSTVIACSTIGQSVYPIHMISMCLNLV
jgi:hypothetical protein